MPRTLTEKAIVLVVGAALAYALGLWTAPEDPRRGKMRDYPDVVRGRALVNDGDSIEIARTRIRLFGIDAFERDQLCGRSDGTHFPCGHVARITLERMVGNASLTCEKRDVDVYGRMVARCTIGQTDIAAELVREGLALAYRQYSNDYVDEEDEARLGRRGAWDGRFTTPWDYRQDRR
ncbi:MAG TPA: thermonuclease family protein [Candidatus Limnocylindrales bacterium]|nr:thermonuclease family protein [Candidatus Limnocylindrales bacterium]